MPLSYNDTVEYMYSRLPMFTRVGPKAFKKDLHNTLALLDALGNPHLKFKSIHLAGTNGKGSSSHMIAALLQQSGYKTGLYTSPHIKDFGERIRLNGAMIDQQFVIDFIEQTKQLVLTVQPSYFELAVTMAFAYFAEQQVDVAVVETGLGGKLDSTNVINPLLSVITNIGMDHVSILGKTLEKIAGQKAGIIKANTPVVVGEYLDQTRPVFEKTAKEKNAPLIFAQDIVESEKIASGVFKIIDKQSGHSEVFELDLQGDYQEHNLKTVLAAEQVLISLGFNISKENEKQALSNVKKLTGLRGRWDLVNTTPVEIHDVGHNEDGISAVLEQLHKDYPGRPYHFVLGFVRDKDVGTVLQLFPKEARYYFTNAHIPRALSCQRLKDMALAIGLHGDCFDNVNEALRLARQDAGSDGIVVLCGSFFTIAEVD